jgi:hypothetical protein
MLAASALNIHVRQGGAVWTDNGTPTAKTQGLLNEARDTWNALRAAVTPVELLFGFDSPTPKSALAVTDRLAEMNAAVLRNPVGLRRLFGESANEDPAQLAQSAFEAAEKQVESFHAAAHAEIWDTRKKGSAAV